MEWHKYQLREFGPDGEPRTDERVIEAPSPGVAIEYFLATHGMIRYNQIVLSVTDAQADETRADVLALIPDAVARIAMLDEHHVWERQQ